MRRIVEGEEYDSLVVTFQSLQAAQLNDALKTCGVDDADLRRRVCETYLFHSGYFLDSCWFAEGGLRYGPVICFADFDVDNRDLGRMVAPDSGIGTMFHEYAFGAAAWLFEDNQEDASEIETGDFSA